MRIRTEGIVRGLPRLRTASANLHETMVPTGLRPVVPDDLVKVLGPARHQATEEPRSWRAMRRRRSDGDLGGVAQQEVTVPPNGPDRRKQSLYFPDRMLKEITDEAARQDRSLSWLVQKAWRLAREEIKRLPAATRPREDTGNEG